MFYTLAHEIFVLFAVTYKNIRGLLQSCVGSHSLSLENLALRPAQFSPVAKAIEYEHLLRQLHIKGETVLIC